MTPHLLNTAPLQPDGITTRKIVARALVALLFGIAMGYAIGKSIEADAARGRALTLKEYVADFERYRNHLIGNESPIWAMIIAGVVIMVLVFAIYELLVWLVDKVLAAMDRRINAADQPGTPPPW